MNESLKHSLKVGANSPTFYGNNILMMFLDGSYHIETSQAYKTEEVNDL